MVYISVVLRVIFPVLAPEATIKKLITWRFFNLYFDDFSFNDFALLFDSNTDRSSECLSQSFGLAHLQRENLRARQHGEWDIFS